MLRRKYLQIVGTSASASALGAGTAAAERDHSVRWDDGVRFLNFGLPGGRPSLGATVTVDGREATDELRFGQFSRSVDLSSGEHTVETADTRADVTTSTTVTVDDSRSLVSLVGGTGGTQLDVVSFSERELLGSQRVRVANLTDADRLAVSAGRDETTVARGSVAAVESVADATLQVATETGDQSREVEFSCLSLDTAPAVVIGGSVSDAGAPVGTVAVGDGGN
ncbi:MAG: hypothetical protein J07HB67_01709 [halophilic archaeon J07HB67]|jgi:hypothetical protein|nr:MAG: hypothetical protein J07HB67_01709 [halophilic archaeon J07HB67]